MPWAQKEQTMPATVIRYGEDPASNGAGMHAAAASTSVAAARDQKRTMVQKV
jgi:hypothetical protein